MLGLGNTVLSFFSLSSEGSGLSRDEMVGIADGAGEWPSLSQVMKTVMVLPTKIKLPCNQIRGAMP